MLWYDWELGWSEYLPRVVVWVLPLSASVCEFVSEVVGVAFYPVPLDFVLLLGEF